MKRISPALFAVVAATGCNAWIGDLPGDGIGGMAPGTIDPTTGSAGGAPGGVGAGGSDAGTTPPPVTGGGVGAGGPDAGTTPPPAMGGLPCNVQSLVQTRCQGCHSSPPKGRAPFALVTYADLMAHAQAMVTAMTSGVMPPGGPAATSAEIATIQSWINGGFPMATTSCGGTTPPPPMGGTGGMSATPPGGTGGRGGTGGSPTSTPPGGTGGRGGAGGAAGSSGGTPPPATCTAAPTLPANVQNLVQSRCQRCHGNPTRGGAPFSLVSYNDVRSRASAAVAAMQSGAMPAGGPRATSAEIAVLQDWINAGYPSASCPTGSGSGGTGGSTPPPGGSGGASGTPPPPPPGGSGGASGTPPPPPPGGGDDD